jgi:hypothetical protein
MADYTDRVMMWNSYLAEARNYAKKLEESGNVSDISDIPLEGDTLSPEDHYSLMAVLHIAVAIEARTNHYLHELEEKGMVTRKERDALKWLNIKNRWTLLPRIARADEQVDLEEWPHLAISEIHKLRIKYFHVKFEENRIVREIPKKNETLQLYNMFIEAQEDMNVVLGRIGAKRPDVLSKLKVEGYDG